MGRAVAAWVVWSLLLLVLVPAAFLAGRAVRESAGPAGDGVAVGGGTSTPGGAEATPGGATGTATGTGTVSLDSPHQELRTLLPSSHFVACEPYPEREGERIAAALKCRAPSGTTGVDELLADRFHDLETMRRAFATFDYPDGRCSEGVPHVSTWGATDEPLACYTNANGAAVIVFQVEPQALQLVAIKLDGDNAALYDWWQQQEWSEMLGLR